MTGKGRHRCRDTDPTTALVLTECSKHINGQGRRNRGARGAIAPSQMQQGGGGLAPSLQLKHDAIVLKVVTTTIPTNVATIPVPFLSSGRLHQLE